MITYARRFLTRLAAALLARLGFLRRAVAAGPQTPPPAVPLIAAGTGYYPAVLLGLPGNFTPMTGCVP